MVRTNRKVAASASVLLDSGVLLDSRSEAELGEIAPAAEKIAQFLRDTPGSVNVQTSNEAAAPRLNVNIDSQKAEVLGVNPSDAANAASFAIDGAVATRVLKRSAFCWSACSRRPAASRC